MSIWPRGGQRTFRFVAFHSDLYGFVLHSNVFMFHRVVTKQCDRRGGGSCGDDTINNNLIANSSLRHKRRANLKLTDHSVIYHVADRSNIK